MAKMQLPKSNSRVLPKTILSFVIVVIIAFLLLISVVNISKKYFRIKNDAKSLKLEQAELQQKQNKLELSNNYLETPDGKEKELRDKFNIVKPGEGMIVITPADVEKVPINQKTGVSKWWDNLLHGLGFRKE